MPADPPHIPLDLLLEGDHHRLLLGLEVQEGHPPPPRPVDLLLPPGGDQLDLLGLLAVLDQQVPLLLRASVNGVLAPLLSLLLFGLSIGLNLLLLWGLLWLWLYIFIRLVEFSLLWLYSRLIVTLARLLFRNRTITMAAKPLYLFSEIRDLDSQF